MVKCCCIKGCGNKKRKDGTDCKLFSPPRSKFFLRKWTEAINPSRHSYLKLTNNTKICQRHFTDEFFIKGEYNVGSDGKVLVKEFKKWRLTDDAVPTLNMGTYYFTLFVLPYLTLHLNLSLGRPDTQVLHSTPKSSSSRSARPSSSSFHDSPNTGCETSAIESSIEEAAPVCSEAINVESGNMSLIQF